MTITIEFNKPADLLPFSPEWKIAVREAVKRLIRTENKRTPFDDCAIVHLLSDEGYRRVKPYVIALARKQAGIAAYRHRQVGKKTDIYATAKSRKESK